MDLVRTLAACATTARTCIRSCSGRFDAYGHHAAVHIRRTSTSTGEVGRHCLSASNSESVYVVADSNLCVQDLHQAILACLQMYSWARQLGEAQGDTCGCPPASWHCVCLIYLPRQRPFSSRHRLSVVDSHIACSRSSPGTFPSGRMPQICVWLRPSGAANLVFVMVVGTRFRLTTRRRLEFVQLLFV